MSQFPDIGKCEAVVLIIEVTLVNDNYYTHNINSLTSKVRLRPRLNWNPWPSRERVTNNRWFREIWTCNFKAVWGHYDLRSLTFEKEWTNMILLRPEWPQTTSKLQVQNWKGVTIFTGFQLDRTVAFVSGPILILRTYSESWQNPRSIAALHVYIEFIQVGIL